MANPKEKFKEKLQQEKRRNSPTHKSISEGLKNKYPIGFSKKGKK